MIRFENDRKIEENILEKVKKDFRDYYGDEEKLSRNIRCNSDNLLRSVDEKCLDDDDLIFVPVLEEIRQKNKDEKNLRKAKFFNVINKLSENKT